MGLFKKSDNVEKSGVFGLSEQQTIKAQQQQQQKQATAATSDGGGPTETGRVVYNKELEELLLKLDLMEKECVSERLQEEKESMKDEFIALKREIYKLLGETKDIIRARHATQKAKGNTVEVIQQSATIRKALQELDIQFTKLKEVFKKNVKQKGKKYSEEQIDQRFKEMQLIKQQIAESRDLERNAGMKTEDEIMTLTDFRAQMRDHDIQVPVPSPHEWRELTAEEQSKIDTWKARDEQIDVQVGEIGDAVDRLAEIAVEIGTKADKQAELVAGLSQQAGEANEELVAMNNRIKVLLKKQGGLNLACKLVLVLVLLCLVCYIFSLVQKRFSLR